MTHSLYGVLVEFKNPTDLINAVKLVREKGYKRYDTFTPFPIHGMDQAMGLKDSFMGWIVFLGGMIGAVGGFSLQTWVSVKAYPLVISGKPFFSYPAFIPVTFECMVLIAAFFSFFGLFAVCKLPQFYHHFFKSDRFKKATSHGYFLGLLAEDPLFEEESVQGFFGKLDHCGMEFIQS
tara:strand:- start:41 stop:574 length:534 start_codon:yes stop_codon:yes gene_type:complete